MTPKQYLLGSLIIGSSMIATLPLNALASPAAAVDQACMAKRALHGGHEEHRPPMGMAHPPHFLHGMTLSEAQQDKIFELMHQKAPQLRTAAKKSRDATDELRKLALSERYDAARAQSLADKAARTQSNMMTLRAEVDQQIYNVLTVDQRKQVVAEIAAHPALPPM